MRFLDYWLDNKGYINKLKLRLDKLLLESGSILLRTNLELESCLFTVMDDTTPQLFAKIIANVC